MTEETQKRITIAILGGLAALGLLFVLWAMFLNRGTLTVSGAAPFFVNIQGVRTENCAESPCSMILAPGEYQITLQRTGYRSVSRSVSVPIGGEQKEEVLFEFIPVIARLGSEEELNMFANPQVAIEGLEDVPHFYEDTYVAYLTPDPETKRQTLYIRGMVDGEVSEPKVATSFIRTMTDYAIIPNVEENGKIAVIDRGEEESSLYIIDLEQKSRDNVLGFPYIRNALWIPGTDNLLLDAQGEDDITSFIYLYNAEDGTTRKLELKTAVENIAPVTDNRVIAATSQAFTGIGAEGDLGGELVTLNELSATPSVRAGTGGPQLAFVDYTLSANQARLIIVEPSLPAAEKVRLNIDKKSITFLAGGDVYELQFEE